VVRTRDDGERQVLDAIDGRKRWTTADVADAVDVTERRVRQILDELVEDGVVEKGAHPDDGRVTEWTDAGVDDLDDHVELPDFEDGADEESSGNSRNGSYYTWVSATSPTAPPDERSGPGDPHRPASDRSTSDDAAGGAPPG
jgi:DNA-binding HxlR family transcriptional regulator